MKLLGEARKTVQSRDRERADGIGRILRDVDLAFCPLAYARGSVRCGPGSTVSYS